MKPGIYFGLSNEAYQSGPGVSKSQLDDIAVDPAIYLWRKNAPVDDEKITALDMGTALHCLLLEPDAFDARFIVAPEFNRRTTAGKADEKQFLQECAESGRKVMDAEQGRRLWLMRDSVFSHHGARFFLEAAGQCEASIYWMDDETDELCRIRPDKYLTERPVMVDVKKVADMARFARHIEEFRYHVQVAMYREGFRRHFGETPQFIFIAVSESADCGRYPVRLYELSRDDVAAGYDLFRRDLNRFHDCVITGNWGGIQEISRPEWARKKDRL